MAAVMPWGADGVFQAPRAGDQVLTIGVLHKRGQRTGSRLLAFLCQHHVETLNWWYQEQCPMMTVAREARLRRNFDETAQLGTHGDGLPVAAAYQVAFDAGERENYDYEYYEEDLRAFWKQRTDGHEAAATGTIDVESLIEFIKAMQ